MTIDIVRKDRKVEIFAADEPGQARLYVFELWGESPDSWTVSDIFEGSFVFIMQQAIAQMSEKRSDLRVHRRKGFRK